MRGEPKRANFQRTMEEIGMICFKDFKITNPSVSFFFYLVKCTDTGSFRIAKRDRIDKELSHMYDSSEIVPIDLLSEFLNENLLSNTLLSDRPKIVGSKTEILPKDAYTLKNHCVQNLGLSLTDDMHLTSDSFIDIITICYVMGRHGFKLPAPAKKWLCPSVPLAQSCPLRSLLTQTQKRFSVIYGSFKERREQFMLRQTISQLPDNTYRVSYDEYSKKELAASSIRTTVEYTKGTGPAINLHDGILNVLLQHESKPYVVIYDIPSSEEFNQLIQKCTLSYHVVLICDFDLTPDLDRSDIAYIPYQDFYVAPTLENVKEFFKNNDISDEDGSLAVSIFSVSKESPFILHALEQLLKNMKTNEDRKEFCNTLNRLSIADTDKSKETTKYSISKNPLCFDSTMTSSTLTGHIRRFFYQNILTKDEIFLLFLVALHGGEGLTQEEVDRFIPKEGNDEENNIPKALYSLLEKEIIIRTDDRYIYQDSPLIPYALAHNRHALNEEKEQQEVLFEDIFDFLDLIMDELCYRNYTPIRYPLIQETLKTAVVTVSSLLYDSKGKNDKDSDQDKESSLFQKHFSDLWSFHICCLRFFLENHDFASIESISGTLHSTVKEYTERSGQENRQLKSLFILYDKFLNLIKNYATGQDDCQNDIMATIDEVINLMKKQLSKLKNNKANLFSKSKGIESMFSFIEINITFLLHTCIFSLYISSIGEICERCNQEDSKKNIIKLDILKYQSNIILDLMHTWPQKFVYSKMYNETKVSLQSDHLIASLWVYAFCGFQSSFDCITPNNGQELPRYEQLAYFQRDCTILYLLCTSSEDLCEEQKLTVDAFSYGIQAQYNFLNYVPFYALQDYYSALFVYTLRFHPMDGSNLFSYMDNDLSHYKHFHMPPEIFSKMQSVITQLHDFYESSPFRF